MSDILILIQKLIFDSGEDSLSLLYQRGDCERRGDALWLKAGNKVSFDTYFNIFATRELSEYTVIEEITIAITVRGKGYVRLFGLTEENTSKQLQEIEISCQKFQEISVVENCPLKDLPEFCYIEIEAISDILINDGGLYTKTKISQNISVACCFCTYKREKELINNVDNLIQGIINNKKSHLYHKADIYISDNGRTLSSDICNKTDRIYLYKNKNFGGSSGFARCLIEAQFGCREGKYTHFILMDDDAVIQPYVIERTAALLMYLKKEYEQMMVGGALLSKQEPWLQIENGVLWKEDQRLFRGRNVDLRERGNLVRNQEEKINYNGWFYTCIPSKFVSKDNLPLPLFLHGDDIEYGLRNKHGFIRMNGICIWHPNPLANHRPYIKYYNSRNYKIVNNLFAPELSTKDICLQELKAILGLAVCYRYEEALYRLLGCADYLRGIDWLKNTNAMELNKTVMNWKDYDSYEATLLKKEQISHPIDKKIYDKKKLLLNWILPVNKKQRIYSNNVAWEQMDIYRLKEFCIIDEETGEGIILKKSYKKLIQVIWEYIKILFKMIMCYKNVSNEWKEKMEEIKKYSFWKGYLEI